MVIQMGGIDEEQTAKMVDYALDHGINYFDTAYGYQTGSLRIVMGKVLADIRGRAII